MDPEGNMIAMLVQRQAAQSTGWLVCESCIQLFNVDRKVAKEYAKIAGSSSHPGDYCPLGSGPANHEAVALAAAKAWKKLYGKCPRSIEVRLE